MASCANHCCDKHVSDDDECYTCSLCKGPLYCSDECRVEHWIAHDCPNVMEAVTGPDQTVYVPYYWEDLLPESEVMALPMDDPVHAAYSVRHRNHNGTIHQRIQPSLLETVDGRAISFTAKGEFLGRGAAPNTEAGTPGALDKSYTIEVVSGDARASISGDTKEDMIYLRNKDNAAARELSGGGRGLFRGGGLRRRLTKRSQKYVFWPPPANVYNAGIMVPVFGGDIDLTIRVGGKRLSMEGAYKLNLARSSMSKSVKKIFDFQLRTKFRRSESAKALPGNISTKDVQVLRAQDLRGNQVALAFLVNPGDALAQLIDIEFMVGQNQLKEDAAPAVPPRDDDGDDSGYEPHPSYYYGKGKGAKKGWHKAANGIGQVHVTEHTCDARDVDQVTGLAVAVEHEIASRRSDLKDLLKGDDGAEEELQSLENCATHIRAHMRELCANPPSPDGPRRRISPAVDTAIVGALEIMYEPVEGEAMKRKYLEKLMHGGPTAAERIAETLKERMLRARSGGRIKKFLYRAVKSKTKRDIRDLRAAILAAKKRDTSGDYDGALRILNEAEEERPEEE